MKVLPQDSASAELSIDTKFAEFRSSGASGEFFNMTYRAVLSNRADIFAAIAQDVCKQKLEMSYLPREHLDHRSSNNRIGNWKTSISS